MKNFIKHNVDLRASVILTVTFLLSTIYFTFIFIKDMKSAASYADTLFSQNPIPFIVTFIVVSVSSLFFAYAYDFNVKSNKKEENNALYIVNTLVNNK